MAQEETRAVLASIKPHFVDEMKSGRKRYELRKRRIGPTGTTVVIYESKPVGMITAVFSIGTVSCGSPVEIWDKFSDQLGIDKQSYHKYFGSSQQAYAHEVVDFRLISPPSTLDGFGLGTRPPQSWQRFRRPQQLDAILNPA